MSIGLAQEAFDNKRYEEAASRYECIVGNYPDSYATLEALCMVGVSYYRVTDNPDYLHLYWSQVAECYPRTRWARAGGV